MFTYKSEEKRKEKKKKEGNGWCPKGAILGEWPLKTSAWVHYYSDFWRGEATKGVYLSSEKALLVRERERPVTARAGGRIDAPWEGYMVASREVILSG